MKKLITALILIQISLSSFGQSGNFSDVNVTRKIIFKEQYTLPGIPPAGYGILTYFNDSLYVITHDFTWNLGKVPYTKSEIDSLLNLKADKDSLAFYVKYSDSTVTFLTPAQLFYGFNFSGGADRTIGIDGHIGENLTIQAAPHDASGQAGYLLLMGGTSLGNGGPVYIAGGSGAGVYLGHNGSGYTGKVFSDTPLLTDSSNQLANTDWVKQLLEGGVLPIGTNHQMLYNDNGTWVATSNLNWTGSVFGITGDIHLASGADRTIQINGVSGENLLIVAGQHLAAGTAGSLYLAGGYSLGTAGNTYLAHNGSGYTGKVYTNAPTTILENLANSTTALGHYIVDSSGILKYKTPSQLLSEIGASGANYWTKYGVDTLYYNGQVAIGSSSPGPYKFRVNGTTGIDSTLTIGGINKIIFQGTWAGHYTDASISNIGNILSIDNDRGDGTSTGIGLSTDIGFYVNGGNQFTVHSTGVHVTHLLDVDSIPHATTDLDKFLVSNSGVISSRTGSELLSDIGGQAAITPQNVTAGSTKVTLGGTPTGATLQAFSIDVDQTKIDHNFLFNYVAQKHFYQAAIDTVHTTLSGILKATSGVLSAAIAGTDYQAPITPAALTKGDDTNVTLTLGGTPSTALLQAASITAGWTGQLSVARGGTGLSSVTANSYLKGNGTSALVPRTYAEVLSDLGLAQGGLLLPVGTEAQTLYNNNGVWTAHSGVSWDDTNNRLRIGIASGDGRVVIGGDATNTNKWLTLVPQTSGNSIFHLGVKDGSTFTIAQGAIGSENNLITISNTGILTTGSQIVSALAIGTAPFAITSTTKVANLNVDRIDDLHSTNLIYGGVNNGSNIANLIWAATDLTQYKSGFWDVVGTTWAPDTGWWWGITLAHSSNGPTYLYGGQIVIQNSTTPQMYIRGMQQGAAPGSWLKVWTELNLPKPASVPVDGTANYLSKFTAASTIGNSLFQDDGTYTAIGMTPATYKFSVNGTTYFNGNMTFSPIAGSNRWILMDQTNTGTGILKIQAGQGSASYGGGLVLYGHSHASKAGYVTIGISAGANGYFTVNNEGAGDGIDVFKVYGPDGKVWINTINNAASDVDKFLVSTSGTIEYRTGDQLLSDIGGQSGINYWTKNGTDLYYTGGNVGIGTTGPLAPLSFGTALCDKIYLYQGATAATSVGFGVAAGSFNIFNDGSGTDFRFKVGGSSGTELVTIKGTGNVGIGTTAPVATLEVNGTLAFTSTDIAALSGLRYVSAGSDTFTVDTDKVLHHYGLTWKTFSDAPGAPSAALSAYHGIRLYTAGMERVRISNPGNVGIGTTNPTFPLSIEKAGTFVTGNWYIIANIGDNVVTNKGMSIGYDNTTQTTILAANTNSAASGFSFYTYNGSNWAGRAGIGSDGTVSSVSRFYVSKAPSDVVGQGPNLYLDGGTGSSYTMLQQGVGQFILWGFDGASWNSNLTINDQTGYLSVRGVITSTLADGTAPFVLASTTKVTNLNADRLDDYEGAYYGYYDDQTLGNNVDFNAIVYQPGTNMIYVQPIHVPNYTGQTNYPFNGYGQLINFNGPGLFPVQLAFRGDGDGGTTIRYRVKYNAGVNYTWTDAIWHTIWTDTNDGANSGLDADLLDGHEGSYYQVALTNPVTGTGTANYLSKFTATSTIGNSLFQDDGTYTAIGMTPATYKFSVNGTGYFADDVYLADAAILKIGTDSDLQLYQSSGFNSMQSVAQNMSIGNGTDVNEFMKLMYGSGYGYVELKYNGNTVLSTYGSGATVYGVNSSYPYYYGGNRFAIQTATAGTTKATWDADDNYTVSRAAISAYVAANASGGGMTNPMTTAGDMIYGGTSGTPVRVPVGTNNYYLKLVAGVPTWAAGSGTTNPGGSSTEIQYNNGGSFDGVPYFTIDEAHATIKVAEAYLMGFGETNYIQGFDSPNNTLYLVGYNTVMFSGDGSGQGGTIAALYENGHSLAVLWHDNISRLKTTSTGITVTGQTNSTTGYQYNGTDGISSTKTITAGHSVTISGGIITAWGPPASPAPVPKVGEMDVDDWGVNTTENMIEYNEDYSQMRKVTKSYVGGVLEDKKAGEWKKVGLMQKLIINKL